MSLTFDRNLAPDGRTLPPGVTVIRVEDDGALYLLCSSPAHEKPRDFVARAGASGTRCPLCLAIDGFAGRDAQP